MDELKISNIPLKFNADNYSFVDKKTNIFEVDRMFSDRKLQRRRLGAIFITENGKQNEQII